MKKMTLTIIAITVLLFGVNLISANAETVASGSCGANLTWTLDDAGTLTISGTGEMDDYTATSYAPWASYESNIKSVVIEDDVITIGNNAFLMHGNITSATIGDKVTSIGYHAFGGCDSLESITIPNGVICIGGKAFGHCYGLKSVIIGNGVTTIGDCAFASCDNLTSVAIGDSVTTIGDGAFGGCPMLAKVNITDVAAWCGIEFESLNANPLTCGKLYLNNNLVTDLVIPNDVTEIKPYAFCQAGLRSVTIGDNVTTIGEYAFYNSGLKKVIMGDKVTSIEYCVFDGCYDFSQVEYAGSEADWAKIDIVEEGNFYLTFIPINYNSPLFHKNAVTNNIFITKTDNITDWSFAIKVDRQTLDTDYVYVGIYNGRGKMLAYKKAEIESDGKATVNLTKIDGASYVKAFAWHNYKSIAPDEKIDL